MRAAMGIDGLAGKVALVGEGGDLLGRSVALALAARGVSVVVTGRVERALGETVGEIVSGGGKARHVVADPEREDAGAAVARALDVFGGLDLVVATSGRSGLLRSAAPRVREGGRLVAVGPPPAAGWPPVGKSVECVGLSLDAEVDAGVTAQLVVFVCSRAGRGLGGRTVVVR
jgi:NAD(P)-dependent dehydrogenase (short-subunit alcohol dehydrogenase family)